MRRRIIRVLPDAATVAAAAAGEFARAAASSKGPFRAALSGGRTPKEYLSRLAVEPLKSRVPWSRVQIYWGDERCVPPDHADSNYRMAREALLSRVPLPEANIHRIQAELDPEEAARRYEETLPAEIDFVFLGLGADGHTASLFPGTTVVSETTRRVAPVWVEENKSSRVTFTVPLLNAARKVVFVVTGAEKSSAVQRILEEAPSAALPASLAGSREGETLWLLDAPAASLLKPVPKA